MWEKSTNRMSANAFNIQYISGTEKGGSFLNNLYRVFGCLLTDKCKTAKAGFFSHPQVL